MCKFLPLVEFCCLLLICLAFSLTVKLTGNLVGKNAEPLIVDKNVSIKTSCKQVIFFQYWSFVDLTV